MKRLVLLGIILLPLMASAQSPVVGPKAIEWDQSATTRVEAQSLTYKLYLDASPGVILPSVSCTGGQSPFVCKANLPPLSAGTHDLALTASLDGQESAKSTVLSIQVVIVATPQNPRIVNQ